MEFLQEVGAFAAKGLVVFLVVAAIALVFFALGRRRRAGGGWRLKVTPLNERFEDLGDALRAGVLERKELKKVFKEREKAEKAAPDEKKPAVYVLDFDGDILASAVSSLREEINAITRVAAAGDEVVVRLESPGGAVPHYGLAAAQLARLKDRKLKLTVCIDRVAASGGYMMACVADQVVAAPFSVIGSIGVVAQFPNFNRLLKKHDVDFQEMTAGEFKRTLTVFGEITDKGKQKFQAQLEETHHLFKDFVKAQRPNLDVDKVSTGEYWLGSRALELGLVDRLGTSDDYLLQRAQDARLFQVGYEGARSLRDRLARSTAQLADRSVIALLTRLLSLELR